MTTPARIHVGRVARPHGLKGELKLSTFDHDAPSIRVGVGLILTLKDGTQRTENIEVVRHAPDGILVVLSGIRSREDADVVTGADIHVDTQQLPPLGRDEHWAFELVGCAVVDPNGKTLGTITAVDEGTAHALVRVKTPRGEERELPFVEPFVERVDTKARTVVLRPIPGMLDDDALDA